MGGTVLVAEDDALLRDFVLDGLRSAAFIAVGAGDGEEAQHLALQQEFDLFIFDRNLPDTDGVTRLKGLRSRGIQTPAMFLTTLGAVGDRVRGLDSGADDYMVKPFAIEELLARTRSLVRRPPFTTPEELTVGRLTLNLTSHRAFFGGVELPLTAQDLVLLSLFLRNPDRVFTRETLLDQMSGADDIAPAAVEHAISRLRKKLGESGVQDIIETVRGVGYRLKSGFSVS